MSTNTVTASSDAVLSPDARFDDQGLFFTLILGAVLLSVLGATLAFVHLSPVLWLRRMYRPNHTSLPVVSAETESEAAVSQQQQQQQQQARHDVSTTSETDDAQTMATSATDAPLPHSSVRATASPRPPSRKRVGLVLPYRATLLQLPRWREWWQVEETSVEHLESIFTSFPAGLASAAPPGASFVPTADVYSAIGVHAVHVTDTSFQASVMPRVRALQRTQWQAQQQQQQALQSSSSALYAPSAARKADTTTAAMAGEGEAARVLQSDEEVVLPSLPTTPLDPQVALYTFTLRYFITLMFAGVCLTIWIAVIANSDDYLKLFMLRRDLHHCHSYDNNQTGCHTLAPYCTYIDSTAGCLPVGLPGLYDMTVQNIQPASWRWWLVAWLNVGFCVVFVLTTLWFVHTVDAYVRRVMAVQVRYALGYRVACVRGLDVHWIDSAETFTRRFLDVAAYFPRRRTWTDVHLPRMIRGASAQSVHDMRAVAANDNNSHGAAVSGDGDDEDDTYELVDWSGKSCLFSIMSCHYIVTRRSDAVFTQPGRVRELLFTRAAPSGMSRAIRDAESAMSALQEAVAQEKILRRRVAREARADGATNSAVAVAASTAYADVDTRAAAADGDVSDAEESSASGPRLMMRAPFPSCCHRVPAVPVRTRRFRAAATRLNERIAKVADQHANGPVFVVFTDSRSAFEFVNLFHARYGGMLTRCKAMIAGPPEHIVTDLANGRNGVVTFVLMVFCLSFFILSLFANSLVGGLAGSLDNIALIPGVGHAWGDYYHAHVALWLRNIISSYLPVIVLAVFNLVLPSIVRRIMLLAGAVSELQVANGRLYLLTIANILVSIIFQAALQGGLMQLANVIKDPDGEAVRSFFVACVTPVGGYWYAKVFMAATLLTMVDALDPLRLLRTVLMQSVVSVQRNYDALFVACDPDLPTCYSSDLVFLAMGLLFHMTAPLLQLFVVFYFVVRYYTQRVRLYDGYAPSLPPSRDCTDFGIATQVARIVVWLYCVAEIGAVLLMSVRQHTGGVVLCSLTLTTACGMLVYVHLRSRHWIVTLANVRRIHDELERTSSAPNATPRSSDDAAADDATHASPTVEHTVSTATYERQHTLLFDDMRNNPFIGHVLPRKPGTHSRYQPKHQRLAFIDVDDELRRMHGHDYVVQRYWTPHVSLPSLQTTQDAVRRAMTVPLFVMRPLQRTGERTGPSAAGLSHAAPRAREESSYASHMVGLGDGLHDVKEPS